MNYLFPLHASVLEPNLNLAFGEAESMSDFDSPSSSEVTVEAELFFQLQCLKARIGLAASLALCYLTSSSSQWWTQRNTNERINHLLHVHVIIHNILTIISSSLADLLLFVFSSSVSLCCGIGKKNEGKRIYSPKCDHNLVLSFLLENNEMLSPSTYRTDFSSKDTIDCNLSMNLDR